MSKSSSTPHWLGIDLGGTKILAEVFDADWNVIGSKKRKTKVELGREECLERLLKTGRQAVEDAGIDPDALGGVGIGCPGVLNLQTGVLVRAPNLGWENVPVRDLLSDTFGCPAAVANDVDAGTYGEATRGAGRDARCVMGVFPGTGVGGGLVVAGEIHTGRVWSCMEIGHIQVVPDGPRCGCGRRGCLEAVTGRLALSAAASTAALRGQAPWLAEHVGTDPSLIRSRALAESVAHGDGAVRELIVQACETLGSFLGGMVNLLAPDVLVIGGGLAEAMPDLYIQTISESMNGKMMRALADTCAVKVAELGDHATTLGAAAWARHLEETA